MLMLGEGGGWQHEEEKEEGLESEVCRQDVSSWGCVCVCEREADIVR